MLSGQELVGGYTDDSLLKHGVAFYIGKATHLRWHVFGGACIVKEAFLSQVIEDLGDAEILTQNSQTGSLY